MTLDIMKQAFAVLMKKPVRLWGISLLYTFFTFAVSVLFGVIPGLALAITLLLSTSMTMVFLHGFRGEEVKVVQLFDCFRDWNTVKRVLGGMAWMTLWIFLWALIPVVGWIFAIIKIYSYRLTPYILVHEQNVPITEAIRVSEERTKGYRGKMFLADVLTVVGYIIVAAILGLFARIPYIGILFGIILTIVSILYFLLISLYQGLIQAAFYEKITGKTTAEKTE